MLGYVFSQNNNSSVSLNPEVKSFKYDTNYIIKYPERLVIALSDTYRQFDIQITDSFTKDTALFQRMVHYIADAEHGNGISLDYDIIGFSFDYSSVPLKNHPDWKYGKSETFGLGLNFNAYKFRFENFYRRYRGFYDLLSPSYMEPDSAYYQNASLMIATYKSKFIYQFSKHKFSLTSAYANTARQLKSAFSWTLTGSVYGTKLSADSMILPRPMWAVYDSSRWKDWNSLFVLGINGGGGFSFNLVLKKRWFFNMFLNGMLEFQNQKYETMSGTGNITLSNLSLAFDTRATIGYNAPRFFIRLSGKVDRNIYGILKEKFGIEQRYKYVEFTFGWRFKMRTPGFYQKFKDTKLYKKFF